MYESKTTVNMYKVNIKTKIKDFSPSPKKPLKVPAKIHTILDPFLS